MQPVIRSRSQEAFCGLRCRQQQVWPLFVEGRLKPQVEQVFSIKDVEAAFAALESNQVQGKVVLQIDASLN